MELNQSSFKTCFAKGLIYSVPARDSELIYEGWIYCLGLIR